MNAGVVIAAPPAVPHGLGRFVRFALRRFRRLAPLIGSPARTRLSPVWQGWATRDAARASTGPTWGRSWVARFHVVIGAGGATNAAALLFVLESDAIGTASVQLHQRGILMGPGGPAARSDE